MMDDDDFSIPPLPEEPPYMPEKWYVTNILFKLNINYMVLIFYKKYY